MLEYCIPFPLQVDDALDSLDDHLKLEGESLQGNSIVPITQPWGTPLAVPTWDSVCKSCVDFNNIRMVGDSNHSTHHNKLYFYSRGGRGWGHWTVNYTGIQSFKTTFSY